MAKCYHQEASSRWIGPVTEGVFRSCQPTSKLFWGIWPVKQRQTWPVEQSQVALKVQEVHSLEGNGTLSTWRGRLSLSFRAVKRCSTARFFLALGVPTARHAGFMPRVCGRPGLCHHHPTFLCRQFALVDTEQSRLADGEWFAISPKRYQQQAFTIPCLPSSPIDPEFAQPSPSQAILPRPQADPVSHASIPNPRYLTTGGSGTGPILRVQS